VRVVRAEEEISYEKELKDFRKQRKTRDGAHTVPVRRTLSNVPARTLGVLVGGVLDLGLGFVDLALRVRHGVVSFRGC
jgi:hypothetical protein